MKTRGSFTLLETMLAVTIIVLILGTVYSFYAYSVKLTVHGREVLNDTQLARVTLFKIAGELKTLTASGVNFTTVISGDPDRIGFITTAIPSRLVFFPTDIMDKGRVIEHDLRSVQYYIAPRPDNDTKREDNDTKLGLQRDELRCLLTPILPKEFGDNVSLDNVTAEDLESAQAEAKKYEVDLGMDSNKAVSDQPLLQQTLISDRIKYLRFDYYDGKRWLSSWHPQSADAIPKAIQVTIGFTEMSEEDFKQEQLTPLDQRPWHEDRYTLLVSLVLADDLKAEYSGPSLDEGSGEDMMSGGEGMSPLGGGTSP